MGTSLRDRSGGLKPRAILQCLGLSALIACAGCNKTAKAEQTCPVGWASKVDGCHDDKGNIWVGGGYRHKAKPAQWDGKALMPSNGIVEGKGYWMDCTATNPAKDNRCVGWSDPHDRPKPLRVTFNEGATDIPYDTKVDRPDFYLCYGPSSLCSSGPRVPADNWPGAHDANGLPLASAEAKRMTAAKCPDANPLWVEAHGKCPA